MTWWVYIIQATDGTLYTGVTTDMARRFREHAGGGRGARYFAGRQPAGIVYSEAQPSRQEAQKREAAIKKLRRTDKQQLLQDFIFFR